MIAWLLCAILAVCEPIPVSQPVQPLTTTEAATMAIAVPLVRQWEGMPCVGNRCEAYLDTIANPPVWTICGGETEGVQAGEVRTLAQCEEGLRRGLIRYRTGLHRYFTAETIVVRLTPQRDAAFVSLAWNVGIAGTGGSTATRRLNAGDIVGACAALTWWNRSGNRVVRGLVNRRAAEHDLCMIGVAA